MTRKAQKQLFLAVSLLETPLDRSLNFVSRDESLRHILELRWNAEN